MSKISVDQLIRDIIYITNQQTGLKMLLDQKKSVMAKYFQKSGKRSVGNDEATVYVQDRTSIEYDVDAICSRLPKSLTDKFIKKTYTIDDWASFVAFLKRHGITGQEVRPFITVSKKVDQAVLSSMYEKGEVSLTDLEGCYEATNHSSVCLRLKNADQQIPIAGGQPIGKDE